MVEERSRIRQFLEFLVAAADLKVTFTIEVQTPDPTTMPGQSAASSQLSVTFDGPDKTLLTARGGEVLLAMEHLTVKMLRLESEEHDRISFEADGFKAKREASLHSLVAQAVLHVSRTGQPYSFLSMTSRERRMLHLALNGAGYETASSGEGARRFVMLFPRK